MKQNKIGKASIKLSEQRHLAAIRRGMLTTLPLIMIGSIAVFINNLPISAYQELMLQLFGDGWRNFGAVMYNASFGIMSLACACSVSYYLISTSKAGKAGNASPNIGMLVTLASVAMLMHNDDGFAFIWTGSMGFFASIVISLASSELFTLLCRLMPIGKMRFASETNDLLTRPLHATVPAIIVLAVFAAVRLILARLGVEDVFQFIYSMLSRPFLGMNNTVLTAILVNLIEHLFWFFGIHGTNLFEPVIAELYTTAMNENIAAVAAGMAPQNILTKPFFDSFVYIGGAGATLCLIIALVIRGRSRDERMLSSVALPMGLFNINEVVTFGLPIVFNPIYIIPFILTPIVLTLTSWAAMATGLVPLTIQASGWTTPALLSGYITTGSWSGVFLQLFNIAVGVIIYIPFVILSERAKKVQLQSSLERIEGLAVENSTYIEKRLLSRDDSAGHLARLMTYELEQAIDAQQMTLHYQPQLDREGKLVCSEALLRWHHPRYGYVAPQVIIRLAEEGGLIIRLGDWILEEAFRQKRAWEEEGLGIHMSINLSVEQLYEPAIVPKVKALLDKFGISPDEIELEVTESIAVLNDAAPRKVLTGLHELGINIAIDDFGMGHSTLMYIKMFPVQTIKLDGQLVHEVASNRNDQEIISSICSLSKSLEISVVAEYVETKEQLDMLEQLGVDIFQGWYYGKAMPESEFTQYARRSMEEKRGRE